MNIKSKRHGDKNNGSRKEQKRMSERLETERDYRSERQNEHGRKIEGKRDKRE